MAENPTISPLVPLKPVDVGDGHGFKAALYSINALFKRCGKSPMTESDMRLEVFRLIKDAGKGNITLLLKEWYSELDEEKDNFSGIYELLIKNDISRYDRNPVVIDIEWSALATIARCCIAVKYISDKKIQDSKSASGQQGAGWKIAVPTPHVFGLNQFPRSYATACIFLVCQTTSTGLSKYIPLIPWDQPVFKPGKILLRSARTNGFQGKDGITTEVTNRDAEVRSHDSFKSKISEDYDNRSGNLHDKKYSGNEKKVSFADSGRSFGEATPVTAPSSPIIPILRDTDIPTPSVQLSLDELATGFGTLTFINSGEVQMPEKDSVKVKIQDDKGSEATVLFERVYGKQRSTLREKSNLEIFGRVYDHFH